MIITIRKEPLESIEILIWRWYLVLRFPIRTSFKYEPCYLLGKVVPTSDFWMRFQLPIVVYPGEIMEILRCHQEELDEDDIYIIGEEDIDEGEDGEY